MAIKTTLKQLTEFFAQSAATKELSKPVRRFAAQLTLLTAHVQRVENKIDAAAKHFDGQLAELASLVIAVQQSKQGAVSDAPPSDENNQRSAAPRQGAAESTGDEGDDDVDEDELVALTKRQVEEELAALENPIPEAPVVVAPPRKQNGGKKAPNAGGVA